MSALSISEWWTIGAGDVLLWRNSKLRTVLLGPRDTPDHKYGGLVFPKIGHSWTGRPTAHYDFQAARSLVAVTGKRRRGLISPAERRALACLGFDDASFWHELADTIARNDRLGKRPCRAVLRALRCVSPPTWLIGGRS